MVTLSALCFALLAHPQSLDKPPVGIYRVEHIDAKGNAIEKNLPTGQKFWLELHRDKTWIMRDFLSAFNGTWTQAPGGILKLRATDGPAGKLKKPETKALKLVKPNVYEFTATRGKATALMRFTYDPNFLKQLDKEYREIMKKAQGQHPPRSPKPLGD